MKPFINGLWGGAILVLAAMAARGGEEKIPLDKVPKAVLDAVTARFPDAKLHSAGKEKEDGKFVYEIAIKNKGKKIDVTLSPKGKILGMEKEISVKDLPKAVAKTLKSKYPKAKFHLIEEVIKVKGGKEKLEYYETLLETAQGKRLEAIVGPDGRFLKEEDKSKKKD